MFTIDLKSRIPIYEQLKNSTLELIMHGVLKADDPIPSVRALAKQLGVNPNTIQKSYQDMEKEGIIYSLVGRGSFIKTNKIESQVLKNTASKRLSKSAYDARLYGLSLDEAMDIVKKSYERGLLDD